MWILEGFSNSRIGQRGTEMLPDVGLQNRVKVLKFSVCYESNYEHLSGNRDVFIKRQTARLVTESGEKKKQKKTPNCLSHSTCWIKKKNLKIKQDCIWAESHFLSILQPAYNLGHLTTQFLPPLCQRGNCSSGDVRYDLGRWHVRRDSARYFVISTALNTPFCTRHTQCDQNSGRLILRCLFVPRSTFRVGKMRLVIFFFINQYPGKYLPAAADSHNSAQDTNNLGLVHRVLASPILSNKDCGTFCFF